LGGAFERALLRAVALEDAGVEVERVPRDPGREAGQAPGEQRGKGLRHGLRGEPAEEPGEGGRTREAAEAEELAHRLIRLERREVGEAAGPGEHAREEGQEDLVRWRGVGGRDHERERGLEPLGQADPLSEGHEEREAPEGRHRLVRERDPDCLLAAQRGKLRLHRFVLPSLGCEVWQPHVRKGSGQSDALF
jgi:hypothetical protein